MGLLCLAFVVYGSLAPFSFRSLSIREARDEFQRVLDRPLHFESRSDVVVNVLLMVPVSFCLMGAMGVDRTRWLALGDAVLVLPLCVGTSFAVEFAQVFLPNRISALEDIVTQSAGAVAGVFLWCVAGQKLTDVARRVWAPSLPVRLDARLLPAYLLLLALVHLVPLDLITSPVDLYRKFKHGLINLVPFRCESADVFGYAEGRLIETFYFFLLGLMLPGLPWAIWRDRKQVARVLGWSLVLVAGVTGLKLLAASRAFDVTDLLLGTLACLIGWEVSLAVRQTASEGARRVIVSAGLWGGLALWLALVTFVTWQPFDWDLELGEERLRSLPLVPFVDALRGDPLNAFASLVQKLVLYLPLGVLVTTWRPTPARFAWVPALVCGAVVALTLEAGQLFLASRTATLTDVYIETAGAVLGSVITRRVCLSPESKPAAFDRLRSALPRTPMAWQTRS
jgi:glycopeptide antibiotics resistance protein